MRPAHGSDLSTCVLGRTYTTLLFRAPPLMLLQGSQNESAMILRDHSDSDLWCIKIWRNCGKKQCLLTRWVSITSIDTPQCHSSSNMHDVSVQHISQICIRMFSKNLCELNLYQKARIFQELTLSWKICDWWLKLSSQLQAQFVSESTYLPRTDFILEDMWLMAQIELAIASSICIRKHVSSKNWLYLGRYVIDGSNWACNCKLNLYQTAHIFQEKASNAS